MQDLLPTLSDLKSALVLKKPQSVHKKNTKWSDQNIMTVSLNSACHKFWFYRMEVRGGHEWKQLKQNSKKKTFKNTVWNKVAMF